MSKNRKLIICLSVVVLVAIVLFLALYIYPKMAYSLEYVKGLLNSEKDITNINVVCETKEETNVIYDNMFIKDNSIYGYSKNSLGEIISEVFYNPNTNKYINVLINEKKIFSFAKSVEEISEPSETSNFFAVSENAKYQYIGKEEINGKQCIKVCLTNEGENEITRDDYYIDLESKYIVKHETYEGKNISELEKIYEITYTYSYNTVTDTDLVEFDINDYPNYEYND